MWFSPIPIDARVRPHRVARMSASRYVSQWVAILILLALSGALASCRSAPEANITTSVTGPDLIVWDGSEARPELSVQVQLHNPRTQPLELLAATPCNVFHWSIADAQATVAQAETFGICIQEIAVAQVPPTQSLTRKFTIALNPASYVSGEHYRLRYTFWGYHGGHDFMFIQQ